jgi:amidase
MPSLARRVVVLLTTLTLVLGVAGGAAPAAFAAKPVAPSTVLRGIDVDASTIPQLQRLMDRHKLTAVQLTQFYLHRIQKLEPRLNAVIRLSARALTDAQAADKARRKGSHKPLLGIPVLLKDNIGTTGMPTTAGSWALAGSTPSDAFIVGRLRAAGAIVLGKLNLSEWANFRSGPSSSGWSGIGGQTNMPYVLDRNPCGSSSGSGVATAADLATFTIGTETDGSIVCPSGANGVVGIKPTLGLWSRAGVVPISADQDTAGPITRNVTDAAVVLGALTGIDSHDAATAAQAGHALTDYTAALDAGALKGARIGIWREGTYGPSTAALAEPILSNVIAALRAAGATVVDPTNLDLTGAFNSEFPALLCEFKTDIATYLQTYTAAGYPKTLADLIAFDKAHPDLEGPWNDAVFEAAEATGGRATPDCVAARADATPSTRAAIDSVMAANHLDAIVGLTNGPAWVTNSNPDEGDMGGDFTDFIGSSTAAAVAGYAAITVPAAYDGPLPIGITFTGGRWSEARLIGLAYAYEQATHVRVQPQFLPSIGANAAPVKHGNSGNRSADAHAAHSARVRAR